MMIVIVIIDYSFFSNISLIILTPVRTFFLLFL